MGGLASGGHERTADEAADIVERVQLGEIVKSTATPDAVDDILRILTGLTDASAASFLRSLLAQLVADKRLPKYQFERRFDCFLGPFLPAIAEWRLGGHAELVVPEFPLKKKDGNQSTNADYLMVLRDRIDAPDAWLLVELKTDPGSYNLVQADIYSQAVHDGWKRLRADLEQIRNASKNKAGYTYLIRAVDQETPAPEHVEVLYLTPGFKTPHNFHSVTFSELQAQSFSHHPEVWELLRALVLPSLV